MSASVIFSYAFMYFVLFLVVPFVLVTFTMTCIKFFKGNEFVNSSIKLKANTLTNQPISFVNKLNTLAKDKYNVLYGTTLDSLCDVDKDDKEQDAHSYLQACHLDYVLVDNQSSAVKLVITDPQHNSDENNRFIDATLAKMGVKVLHLAKNDCDVNLIKNSLVA
ncbi:MULTISPECIES: DUF2726 domain-containing protein [Shewanella]|uniref:DUF2726 domain-containing protein n=1 Tax=Shewanella pneumatophori TaxID=314092 RepID=A0A9X1ZLU3_9GAMM|nr:MULTISPECIES: DUF2726 domain-containing protein [Shewanella]MCK8046945.1 DUF2726 domain-containing protein [Shewanella sp. 1CM18E]MCL1138126.1 DUF2726 domain-containing protein [Shewanella pneumatophori]